MIYDSSNLRTLEDRYERLLLLIGDLQAAVGRLQQLVNDVAGSQQKPGGSGLCYSMVGVVIAAGGSVTGATVNALVGGSTTAVSTNATVYNQMYAATLATGIIMLGGNPDGTYSVLPQSSIICYSMAGVVIAAGGSVTGATVKALVGGTATTVSTTAKVYNQMQAATVVTKTIMLGMNPDGTFSAISQSC